MQNLSPIVFVVCILLGSCGVIDPDTEWEDLAEAHDCDSTDLQVREYWYMLGEECVKLDGETGQCYALGTIVCYTGADLPSDPNSPFICRTDTTVRVPNVIVDLPEHHEGECDGGFDYDCDGIIHEGCQAP